MLEEEEDEDEEVGEREGGLELDMWEGQFSLGGVGEGLGEGVWRQEEGVSCRKLAQEVWASQQEKEEDELEAEDVFCNAINFTSIHVNCHISLSIPPWPEFSWRIFGFPTNFHFFCIFKQIPDFLPLRCNSFRSRSASWRSLRQRLMTGEKQRICQNI